MSEKEQIITTIELIISAVMFIIAGVLILLSIRSFLERGFVLNNAYIYSSEEERKKMNNKPYYRQTAIIFLFLSVVFIIIGTSVILQNQTIELIQIPVITGAVVYTIVSSIKINKKQK